MGIQHMAKTYGECIENRLAEARTLVYEMEVQLADIPENHQCDVTYYCDTLREVLTELQTINELQTLTS